MEDLIEGVSGALVGLSSGLSKNPNRLRVFVEKHRSMIACMPAYLGDAAVLGAKIVGSCDAFEEIGQMRKVNSVVVLMDAKGQLLSIMSGAQLGPMRTAAASAVAIRNLAREDASSIAMIGCGAQAYAELAAACVVRPLRKVYAFDVKPEAAERFREKMSRELNLEIVVTSTAELAVENAEIITLATTSAVPVVNDAAIRTGTHINAMGAHTPSTRELESATVARSRFFAESRDALFTEAGDVLIPISEGMISQSHVVGEIGEVLSCKVPGRLSSDDVTIFKSTGISVEDVIAAKIVYDRAIALNIGHRVSF